MKIITQADCDIINDKIYNKLVSTEYPRQPTFIDMSGMNIDDLHVDYYAGRLPSKESVFMCTCKCGNRILRLGEVLRSKDTYHSCGCRTREKTVERNKTNTTHGDSRRGKISHLYMIWCSMRYRCYNPKCAKYPNYGGRGLTIYNEWLGPNGYSNFREWSLNNGYEDGLSIDRMDNDIGYYPENCRWVNCKIQNRNQTSTPYIVIGTYALPITVWSEISGTNARLITTRVDNGWDYIDAVFTPPREKPDKYKTTEIYVPEKYDIYNKYQEFVRKGRIVEYSTDMFNFKLLFQNHMRYY